MAGNKQQERVSSVSVKDVNKAFDVLCVPFSEETAMESVRTVKEWLKPSVKGETK